MDPRSCDQVADSLLRHLRESLQAPEIVFAEPPARLFGGCQTFVHSFRLGGAPPPYDGPLVLRMIRGSGHEADLRCEAVLQDALIEQGYPTPCVLACTDEPPPLGTAFQIMERLPGRPMMLDGFDPDEEMGVKMFAKGLGAARQLVLGDWPARLAGIHARLHDLDGRAVAAKLDAAGIPRRSLALERRLDRYEAEIERAGLEGMRPALTWLREHRPRGRDESICHGDLFGNQVFERDGRVTGVIDWSEALFAPAEIDVGLVKAGIESLPLPLPVPFAGLGKRLLRRLAGRFVSGYQALRPLDPALVRYGEALRCVGCLVGVGRHRYEIASGRSEVEIRPLPFDTPLGVVRLSAHLEGITGLAVAPGSGLREAA